MTFGCGYSKDNYCETPCQLSSKRFFWFSDTLEVISLRRESDRRLFTGSLESSKILSSAPSMVVSVIRYGGSKNVSKRGSRYSWSPQNLPNRRFEKNAKDPS